MMRTPLIPSLLLSIAALSGGASAQLDSGGGGFDLDSRFPAADRIKYSFTKKALKLFQLESDLDRTKIDDDFPYKPGRNALAILGRGSDSFGVIATPNVGTGEYGVQGTVGFLSLNGIEPGQTTVGIEVDLYNSNPLQFFFLGVFWQNAQLWAFASSDQGNLGSAVSLGASQFATLAIVQTATELIFYAKAVQATTWLTIATVLRAPWVNPFRVYFGSSHLSQGAYALVTSLALWGAIFDPLATSHIVALQSLLADVNQIYLALILQSDYSVALNQLALLFIAIQSAYMDIESDGRAGLFLRFVLWRNAIKFLQSAYKTGRKLEQSLQRASVFRSLPSVFAMYQYLALASLSLRGLAVKKAEILRIFRNFSTPTFPTDGGERPATMAVPIGVPLGLNLGR